MKHIVKHNSFILVYNFILEWIINYGISIWKSSYNIYFDQFNVTQKWIVKIILRNVIKYITEQLYPKSDVSKMRQLYVIIILNNMQNEAGTALKFYILLKLELMKCIA